MSEQTTNEQTTPQSDPVRTACNRAAGEAAPAGKTQADANEAGVRIRGGHKNLNAKGRGEWWYRMVWRAGSWQYFSDERLPMGTFLAADRRASVRGDVFPGELVCSHDKGGPVDAMWLIVAAGSPADSLVSVPFRRRRDGMLVVTLPDGREVAVPNPRSR